MFSLEECSDIEPISEDDEVDGPICEVQVSSLCNNTIGWVQTVEWITGMEHGNGLLESFSNLYSSNSV